MVHIVLQNTFPDLPGNWVVTEQTPDKPITYRQRLKLKFECSHCRRGKRTWSSMKGTAEFKIWRDRRNNINYIMCSIYGQMHKHCSTWSEGEVYLDEFEELALAVVEKFSNPQDRREINHKKGNPTKNHDTARCEACALGKCNGSDSV